MLGRPGAVVEDLEADLGGLVGEVDDRPRPTRVAEGVRQRLLGDPVDRDVEARRQRARLSIDLELGGKPRRLDPLDEYRDAIDARLRTEAAASSAASPSSPRTPRRPRSSRIASRPVASTARSDSSARSGAVRMTWRAAPAWMSITLTLWATMS